MGQMILGNFIFSLLTASFDDLDHSTGSKWSSHERIGKRSTHQYLGVDDEEYDLNGVMYPAFAGQTLTLQILRNMADRGKPYFLITGNGFILGQFIILAVNDKRSNLFSDGAAQKIEFSLKLRRYDDDKNTLETITDAIFG
jgi:phage protein U